MTGLAESLNSRRGRSLQELLGPIVVVLGVALASNAFGPGVQLKFWNTFVITSMVVGLYVFSGNSGVISFGHASFVAVGAFSAGMFSMAVQQKKGVFPALFPLIKDHQLGNIATFALGIALGALFAAVVGVPLVRLSGLSAGIATFAVLSITRNVLRNWNRIGPGAKAIPSVSETTKLAQSVWVLVCCIIVAWLYQRSRFGRRLRATREDAAAAQSIGVRVFRERWIAFVLSGALSGTAGAAYVHLLGSVNTDQVYLELTFLVLAMLVVGGIGSLWGAVLGGLLISLVNTVLVEGEKGLSLFGWRVTFPTTSSNIVLAVLMIVTLLWRPDGLTRGSEFRLPVTPGSLSERSNEPSL